MPYATLLFDLDHTLFDSDASEAEAFAYAMGRSGVGEPAGYFPTYDRINRGLWAAIERGELATSAVKQRRFEELVTTTGLAAEPARLADDFLVGLGRFGDLYPGARDVLAALAARADLALALVTNGLAEVQRARIERLELAPYFRAIVISSEVGVAKPARAIFDLALASLGEPARASAVMIGDSLSSDLRGGRAAGIATCWFNPHHRVAPDRADIDHEIAALSELLALT